MTQKEDRFANPYLAGIALGLVLLSAFLIMGNGLGASGAASRLGIAALDSVAAEHVDANSYMKQTKQGVRGPLDNWFVFEVLGVFLGGAVSAYAAGRMRRGVIRGPRVLVPMYRLRGRVEYHVACFELATGALSWSANLISGQRELNMFGRHVQEFSGPPLVVAGDRVIALTQLGTIAALDLYTGDVLWETLYNQLALPGTVDKIAVLPD